MHCSTTQSRTFPCDYSRDELAVEVVRLSAELDVAQELIEALRERLASRLRINTPIRSRRLRACVRTACPR